MREKERERRKGGAGGEREIFDIIRYQERASSLN